MKEGTVIVDLRVCPKCGRSYHGVPALSREDNKTPICPDCGAREAMASIGVSEEEQEQILRAMHGCMNAQ